ncbi:MarR family winged helix-turn-helix transcriptional regulator [Microbacterium sp. HJ5]
MSSDTKPLTTSADHLDDHSAAASRLRIATFRLARRMRTQRAVDSMSDGQFAVLAALWVHGSHTLGELAERERVSAPSMNRTVNCLQESGYVSRAADESDGRKVVISLTDAGRAVVDETARRRDAWVEAALADLTPAERETLDAAAELMQRMVAR